MLRSLMTAVTGVKAHQTMLDVTGHNIANVNTTGYKKDFTVFQDLLYQTSQGASGPGANRGGINPAQVGLGVSVAAIETIHTQGGAQTTGNKSDMMINGDGFFVLKSGESTLFSRAGAFTRDADNNLVQSGTGYRVQGYKMERDPLDDTQFVRSGELSDINIPMGKKMPARGTTVVDYQCNLDTRSNAYLPIGFEDLRYNNAPCGLPATVTINGIQFDAEFQSNPAAKAGESYLTITLTNGSENAALVYDMKGIDADTGRPTLVYNATASSSTRGKTGDLLNLPVPGTTAIPMQGFGAAGTLGGYDSATGVLQINDLKVDLSSKMHYQLITLQSSDGASTLPMLAEFNEKPGQIGASPISLTLWYRDTTVADATTAGAMKSLRVDVHLTDDGKFKALAPTTTPATAETSTALGLTTAVTPFNLAGAFRIAVNDSGSGLEFQVAKDLTTAVTDATQSALYGSTVASITQGGYHQTKKDIFDCQGNKHTLEVNFKKVTENRWRWEAFLVDSEGNRTTEQACNTGESVSSSGSFGASGELSFCRCGWYCDVETNKATIELPFSLDGGKNQTITLNFGGDGDTLNGVTQFASDTTTKAVSQDGYTMGTLKDYSVGKDGLITGVYTNDQNQPLYRVALATFANQQGLEKVGDTAFIATVNSGEANIDAADSGGRGTITGGTVEVSNVDLTEEFTRLIISQRGFQANTRVVTTSDQILEEVVNLKR